MLDYLVVLLSKDTRAFIAPEYKMVGENWCMEQTLKCSIEVTCVSDILHSVYKKRAVLKPRFSLHKG